MVSQIGAVGQQGLSAIGADASESGEEQAAVVGWAVPRAVEGLATQITQADFDAILAAGAEVRDDQATALWGEGTRARASNSGSHQTASPHSRR